MNIELIIKSGIDDAEKISLITQHIEKLERTIIAYKLRDKNLIEQLLIAPDEYKVVVE